MGSIRIADLDGKQLWMPQDVRETHMQVLGGSRMGKSYFLEHMIRQDIINGSGVCVIDPHGEMYDNLIAWLAVSGAGRHRQVHLINPSEDDWSVGFNPFCAGEVDPSVRVDMMVDACAKVWGKRDMSDTPRLSKCLELVFYALAAHRLSIAEARMFSTWPFKDQREILTADLGDWDRNNDWCEFNGYDRRDFVAYMESTNSKLLPFASKPRVRRLMGQTQNVIDFKRCMEERHIVLVNLAGKGKLSEKDAQVIGAMLFADIYHSAKLRTVATAGLNPFYCYVDECADYVTEHVAKSMDQVAKYGLHFILAHHRMSQLEHYGDAFCEAIMAGAQTKVVFRVDIDGAAEELGRHLYRREFDIESRKEGLTMPVGVGQEIVWLRGHMDAETEGGSHSRGSVDGTNSQSGESVFEPDEGDAAGVTSSSSDGDSHSTVETDSNNWSRSHSESANQSLKTIYEERGIPKTLEEIIHEATVKVRTLPKRNGLVYMAGAAATIQIRTPDLLPARTLPSARLRAVKQMVNRSEFTHPNDMILRQIEARRERQISAWVHSPIDDYPDEPLDAIELTSDDDSEFRHQVD